MLACAACSDYAFTPPVRSSANVRFAAACKVADAFFGEPRQRGTSHRVWKTPWAGDPRVNMQEGEGGKAKTYQVKQLLAAIDRYDVERQRAREDAKKKKEDEAKKGGKRASGKKKGRRA